MYTLGGGSAGVYGLSPATALTRCPHDLSAHHGGPQHPGDRRQAVPRRRGINRDALARRLNFALGVNPAAINVNGGSRDKIILHDKHNACGDFFRRACSGNQILRRRASQHFCSCFGVVAKHRRIDNAGTDDIDTLGRKLGRHGTNKLLYCTADRSDRLTGFGRRAGAPEPARYYRRRSDVPQQPRRTHSYSPKVCRMIRDNRPDPFAGKGPPRAHHPSLQRSARHREPGRQTVRRSVLIAHVAGDQVNAGQIAGLIRVTAIATTVAPWACNILMVARPMPEVPPNTNAFFPCKSISTPLLCSSSFIHVAFAPLSWLRCANRHVIHRIDTQSRRH